MLLIQPMDNIVTRIQVGYSEGIVHYRCRQRRNYYNMPAHSMVMELSNKRVLSECERNTYHPTLFPSFFHVMLMLLMIYVCLDLWRGLVPSLALILNPAINYTTFGLVKGESQWCNWMGKCLVARLAQI